MTSGLTLASLGGVLAHEFGHFSQGSGMRFGYLIRVVNHWFFRVVYERDKWDEKLDEFKEGNKSWLTILAMIASVFIWISRRALWVFMRFGQLASMNLSRQMEFNADTYEARLAGSAAFKETTIQIRVLSSAKHYIDETVNQIWNEGKLPQNYPELIGAYASSYSESAHQSIEANIAKENTKILDSHPCDKDRIEFVNKLNNPGIFDADRPARDLFIDFDKLSERCTRHQYGILAGIDLEQVNFVPSSAALQERERADDEEKSFNTFTNGFMSCHLKYDLDTEVPKMNPLELCRFMRERINFLSAVPDGAYRPYSEIYELNDEIIEAETIHSLYLCRLKMMARAASLNKIKGAESAREISHAKRLKYSEAKSKATDIAYSLSQLFLASKALILPTLEDPHKSAEFLAKFTLFKKLLEADALFLEANVDKECLREIFEAWEGEDVKPEDRVELVSKHQSRNLERFSQLKQGFSELSYPYPGDQTKLSVYQYLAPRHASKNDILRDILQEVETFGDRFVSLRIWLAKDICYLAYPLLVKGLKAVDAVESV